MKRPGLAARFLDEEREKNSAMEIPTDPIEIL
jgi:hypothetical protein